MQNQLIKQEYLNGTLAGWLNNNPSENSALQKAGYPVFDFPGLCERLAQKTGRRVAQKSRGVIVWK